MGAVPNSNNNSVETNVIAFRCEDKRKPRTMLRFPLSVPECLILLRHVCERSPELCEGITDPGTREIVERFLDYAWQSTTLIT